MVQIFPIDNEILLTTILVSSHDIIAHVAFHEIYVAFSNCILAVVIVVLASVVLLLHAGIGIQTFEIIVITRVIKCVIVPVIGVIVVVDVISCVLLTRTAQQLSRYSHFEICSKLDVEEKVQNWIDTRVGCAQPLCQWNDADYYFVCQKCADMAR